ncbi:MAG: 3-methyl-2-oxobutanoate hydroxymethyltransferase [Acidaminococcales bacterium]|nr:3-methyl-2-oxobutanoate hydroxymethyltransferase [Acidaminococcales bacterium]
MGNKRITTATVRQMKKDGRPLVMITAYDYPWAKMFDAAGADVILVGDSLGNVALGYDSTLPVTMEDMIHHAKAVCRGVERAMVVVDMPFMSYQVSAKDALRNAGRLMKESGAQAVKLEGGREALAAVRAIVAAGIPVVAHIGLTPQSVHQLGGFRVQGKDSAAAGRLLDDAIQLSEAGAFAVVLECVPAALGALISEKIPIPTIGIGAGAGCDGQVLVYHDMLGLFGDGFKPKFAKRYKNLYAEVMEGVGQYVDEVRGRRFPSEEHSFPIDQEILEKLY